VILGIAPRFSDSCSGLPGHISAVFFNATAKAVAQSYRVFAGRSSPDEWMQLEACAQPRQFWKLKLSGSALC